MAITGAEGVALLVGRVLLGGVLAFMGLNHFMQTDGMAAYAEAKGVPVPRFAVLFSGGQLVFGGVLLAAGLYPVLAAGALASFFVVATPMMHDFWAVPEDQKQDEMTGFLKNVGLLGASLLVLAIAGQEWAFAAGLGL
ncbi:DoxX family protein [Halorubellus sp. JP-L1]|uniref:DoxX family protein n=1 Tax=Halorubellus sp. JP-L1 TaxID=2715753 RepID=UPI00140E578D|nr:DoxX family protein [Halorubellus sp. JP-L1]NHN40328.1 DoxX family protein [Halorubellus sp. JP-L1]